MRVALLLLALACGVSLAANTGTWTTVPPATGFNALRGHTALSIGANNIYIFGGASSAGIALGTIYRWNYPAGTFSTLTNVPIGGERRDHCAMTYNNRYYVFFGYNNAALDTSFYFDVGTSGWTGAPSAPVQLYGVACAFFNNKGYFWGGRNNAGVPQNSMYTFDFTTNTWATVVQGGAIPVARHDATLTAVTTPGGGTYLYLIAGGDASVVPNLSYNSVNRFDIVANTWASLAPTGGPPVRRYGHAAGTIDATRIVIFGGYAGVSSGLSPNDYFSDIWEYDVVKNTWYNPTTNTAPVVRYESIFAPIQGTTSWLMMGGIDKNGAIRSDFMTLDYTPQVCPAGQFSADGIAACTDCPTGSYSSPPAQENTYSCPLCGFGTFANTTGLTSCFYCPAGMFGTATGAISQAAGCANCGAGKYAPQGPPAVTSAAGCINCPVGTASNALAVASCPTCPSGQYTDIPAQSTCSPCTAGSSCVSGIRTPCPAGKFQNLGSQTVCLDCPSASYSLGGASSCTPCPKGTFSTAPPALSTSAAVCQSCPMGTYQDVQQQTSCKNCGAGKYSSSTGNTLATQCLNCPAGTASSAVTAISLTNCTSCLAGSYSTGGASICSLCNPGTYNPNNGSTSAAACVNCPTGTTVSFSGASTVSQCSSCPAGTWSNSGICTNCPAGTYSPNPGASAVTACVPCPHNSISPVGSPQCYECDPGTTAVGGSSYCETCATTPAAQFTYADFLTNRHLDTSGSPTTFTGWTVAGAVSRSSNGFTQAGSTNANFSAFFNVTSTSPTGSIAQTTSPSIADINKQTLAFSLFVLSSGISGVEDNNWSARLLVTYTDLSTATFFLPLPLDTAGKWVFKRGFALAERGINTAVLTVSMSSHTGTAYVDSLSVAKTTLTSCACDPGLYNEPTDMTLCNYCELGHACVLSTQFSCPNGTHAFGGREVCTPCPAGWYCIGGRGFPCGDNTYPDPVLGASCLPCPPGYKCPSGVKIACEAGHYGLGTNRCYDCTEGTFNNNTAQPACSTCPNGYTSARMAKSCFACPRGEYSTLGAPCRSCPAGTFNNATASATCTPCPIGSYTPTEAYTWCITCPGGKTTAAQGSKFLEQCV